MDVAAVMMLSGKFVINVFSGDGNSVVKKTESLNYVFF